MGQLLKNIDTFCGRLNAGLAAVAVVLSIVVAAELTVRLPNLFQQAAMMSHNISTSARSSSNRNF